MKKNKLTFSLNLFSKAVVRLKRGAHVRRIAQSRVAIQRGGSILAWTVILSVYGADTMAISLFLRSSLDL
jgi:hypothetical protein